MISGNFQSFCMAPNYHNEDKNVLRSTINYNYRVKHIGKVAFVELVHCMLYAMKTILPISLIAFHMQNYFLQCL